MDYKKAKYAIVLGRHVDGCGCQRCNIEMKTWCDRNNIDVEIFAHVGKKSARFNSQQMDYVGYKEKDLDDIQKRLNEKDVVIFASYPYAKFDHSYIRSFYDKIIKGLDKPIKVGFIYELHKTYINKIPYIAAIMNNMDVIYGYGPNTWFNQSMEAMFPHKKEENRVRRMTHAIDLEEMKQYRNDQPGKERKIMFCGRWTTTKGPSVLLNLAPHIKKLDPNFVIKLRGIEKSIGAKTDIYDNPYCIDCTGKNGPKANEKGCAEVYKEYAHADAMKELSNTMFGFSGFHLKESEYSDRVECSMAEYINCGAIPVFSEHWAKHNHLIASTGETYYDYNLKHPFMITFTEDTLEETAKKIIEVSNDEKLQKIMIDNGYEILKKEFDPGWIVPDLFQTCLDLGYDKHKFKTEEDLIRHLIDDEFVDEYLKLYEKYKDKDIVVLDCKNIYENNTFAIVEGNKNVVIKEFKKSRLKKKQ